MQKMDFAKDFTLLSDLWGAYFKGVGIEQTRVETNNEYGDIVHLFILKNFNACAFVVDSYKKYKDRQFTETDLKNFLELTKTHYVIYLGTDRPKTRTYKRFWCSKLRDELDYSKHGFDWVILAQSRLYFEPEEVLYDIPLMPVPKRDIRNASVTGTRVDYGMPESLEREVSRGFDAMWKAWNSRKEPFHPRKTPPRKPRDLTPKQTFYQGYRFRSRLEARWAVFFDSLGIEWDYEFEGFDLSNGGYLPDFFLHNLRGEPGIGKGCWVEVKGQAPTKVEEDNCFQMWMSGSNCLLLVGTPNYKCRYNYYEAEGKTDYDFEWGYDMSSIHRAVNSARSARFEYGETPT